jgi:hypothetical protein
MVNISMKYIVIDNFLDAKTFVSLKKEMYGPNLPWFHNEFLVYEDEVVENNTWNWQLTHTFYKHNMPRSDKFQLLDPVLEKLNPSSIVKIKANLMPRTNNIIVHKLHTDIDMFKGKTSVYYINSNNGYTLFQDGTKVESVENRMVIFDSDIPHTGTSCTNARNRCVLNFNYYEWSLSSKFRPDDPSNH